MNTRYVAILGGLILIVLVIVGFKFKSKFGSGEVYTGTTTAATVNDVKFATPDGVSEGIKLFGEPVMGDLNGDSTDDAAVLFTYDGGGSGTFFYAAFAIKNDTGYTPTNSVLLGDRIAPQTIELHSGRAVYNYAVRKDTEPFTTQPSVGKSTWLELNKTTGNVVEWVGATSTATST